MAKYLTGEALIEFEKKLARINRELQKTSPLKAEGDLATHCAIEGIPLWQGKTECVRADVRNGVPLTETLARYELTEDEYLLNLERLKRGEGVDD